MSCLRHYVVGGRILTLWWKSSFITIILPEYNFDRIFPKQSWSTSFLSSWCPIVLFYSMKSSAAFTNTWLLTMWEILISFLFRTDLFFPLERLHPHDFFIIILLLNWCKLCSLRGPLSPTLHESSETSDFTYKLTCWSRQPPSAQHSLSADDDPSTFSFLKLESLWRLFKRCFFINCGKSGSIFADAKTLFNVACSLSWKNSVLWNGQPF
jgi:hypothetical protein